MCPELKIILYSGSVDIPRSKLTSVHAFIPKTDGIGPLIQHVVQFAQATTAAGSPSTSRDGSVFPDLSIAEDCGRGYGAA